DRCRIGNGRRVPRSSPRFRSSGGGECCGIIVAASSRDDLRSGRRLRADSLHRAVRVRRRQVVDRIHDREQRDSGEPARRFRHDGRCDGAHRQGNERQIQGNLRRRLGRLAGALLGARHDVGVRSPKVRLDTRTAVVAWLITAVYYFYQYTLRSAPAVMMPQLSEAFGVTATGVASMAGLFYYGYSPFSLVAGAAIDRLGPGRVVPLGAAAVGIGALLFASGNKDAASIGRLVQGAGGVFALVGAAYIATTNFPASRAATLVGATQMFGMAGGSAGQFAVGPMMTAGIAWSTFWAGMGILGLAISALLLLLLPKSAPSDRRENWLQEAVSAFG